MLLASYFFKTARVSERLMWCVYKCSEYITSVTISGGGGVNSSRKCTSPDHALLRQCKLKWHTSNVNSKLQKIKVKVWNFDWKQ